MRFARDCRSGYTDRRGKALATFRPSRDRESINGNSDTIYHAWRRPPALSPLPQAWRRHRRLDEVAFRALYKELVEINTTRSVGSCTQAAEAMRARLLAAGIPAADTQILAPPDRPNDGALIAVLHGRDHAAKAILMLAHIDVVEAKREDWERDPFKLVEENGWFYARGASDDKAMAAVFTDSLIRYRMEGFKPRRDIKLALTCGEETPDIFNSVRWLTQTQPKVLEPHLRSMKVRAANSTATTSRSHCRSRRARRSTRISRSRRPTSAVTARARRRTTRSRGSASDLAKLGAHNFAIALNPATRGYFEAQIKLVSPDIAADMRAVIKNPQDEAAVDRLWAVNPGWNGSLRTTCVVTEISGGHAPNALPQHVRANVNCRILPGVPIAEVQKQIVSVLADDKISVAPNRRAGDAIAASAADGNGSWDPCAKSPARSGPASR